MVVDLIVTGLIQGAVLAFVAYGVMIPFRLINFPDLTAEGTYPLGGAICASMLVLGFPYGLAMALATLLGAIVGMGTALIHLKLRVNTLLAGIILSTMVYSVNLRIMGKPNIALFNENVLFQGDSFKDVVLLFGLLLALTLPLRVFLRTEIGLRMRAVGLNAEFARRQGISVSYYTLLGLFLGNGYAGLAGALMVQLNHYADISMGVGMVVHALAALMIGEKIIGTTTLTRQLTAPLIGALTYQQIQGVVLFMGLSPTDLKFFTGAVALCILGMHKKQA